MKYQTQRNRKSKANLKWRLNLSKARKGNPLTKEHKEKIKKSCMGKNTGNKRPDLSEYNKKRKGIFKQSKKSRKKTSLSLGGTGIPYENNEYPEKFHRIRNGILKRDNYKCQICSMIQEEHFIIYGRDIEVHHIDYDKENNEENNLICLCHKCNTKANFNRDYWYAYFSYIMEKNQMGNQ